MTAISRITSRTRKSGFRCPKCDAFTWAIDSRPAPKNTWRRRRACPCGFRFSTVEMPVEMAVIGTNVRAAQRLISTAAEALLEARRLLVIVQNPAIGPESDGWVVGQDGEIYPMDEDSASDLCSSERN